MRVLSSLFKVSMFFLCVCVSICVFFISSSGVVLVAELKPEMVMMRCILKL